MEKSSHLRQGSSAGEGLRNRLHEIGPAGAMLVAVVLVFVPPGLFAGEILIGLDFGQLHQGRLEYVREWLAQGVLPAWYTRELLGSPFLANLQSAPWIPSRLLLYPFEPARAYGLAVVASASLAASFTYLFGRSLGMGRIAASMAGWTFACAGYYAARVMAGHLPVLEAYPALPLLLWLTERAFGPGSRSTLRWHWVLALATAATVMAGHPQTPAYALAAVFVYAAINRRPLSVFVALLLGVGLGLVAWTPMFYLITESTRLLPLEVDPRHTVPFPIWRLLAFVAPWAHGWPEVLGGPSRPFVDPNVALFWNTVCYVGLAPLCATAALGVDRLRRRLVPGRPALALGTIGLLALLTAMQWGEAPMREHEAVILRSSARQLYLTTFALSLAMGWGLHELLRRKRMALGVLALMAIVVQLVDLGSHARAFLRTHPEPPPFPAALAAVLDAELADGRVAVSREVYVRMLRDRDRLGFFDSLPLARPYLATRLLDGRPLRAIGGLEGSSLRPGTMARLGARFLVSHRRRRDLELTASAGGVYVYRVPDPSPRARFFPSREVQRADDAAIWAALRVGRAQEGGLLLPEWAETPSATGQRAFGPADARLVYQRPTPDRILIFADLPEPGFVRVLESWSSGWHGSIDGRPVSVLPADGFVMAVAVDAGSHSLVLEYRTPGRMLGLALAALCAVTLGWLLALVARHRGEPPSGSG
ncbi:MAG: hypothetical protein ABFS46_07150 [Myxococcota bacterium]